MYLKLEPIEDMFGTDLRASDEVTEPTTTTSYPALPAESRIRKSDRYRQKAQKLETKEHTMSTIALQPVGLASRPRLRLTKRGRAVLMSLAATPLVVIALVVSLGGGGGASASLSGSSAGFQYVTVASGETLWQVAQQLAPSADPRDVIAELVRLNRLTTPDVFAGQELAIPSEYARK